MKPQRRSGDGHPAPEVGRLSEVFRDAWPEALAVWGPALRLHDPEFTQGGGAAGDPLAWFGLGDATVTVDLAQVSRLGLGDLAVTMLAHEIGHHVYAPASRAEAARSLARVRLGLGDRAGHAALVVNLWDDTLINDRLHRLHNLPVHEVFRRSTAADRSEPQPWWSVWMRTYELLWAMPTGTLVPPLRDDRQERDAWLLARHTRVFARDPVGGAGGFAALLRPWLPLPQATPGPAGSANPCSGDQGAGLGATLVPGLAGDDSLGAPVLHPALDPRVNPEAPQADPGTGEPPDPRSGGPGDAQAFGPAQLTELYAALGSTRDAAVDHYLTRARRHLVPFPVQQQPRRSDTELQGWAVWELGDDLTDVDWLTSVVRCPVVIPGLTTQQRVRECEPEPPGAARPLDLDLYVDCSGSMPNPRQESSPVALCGAILALSCLRVGGAVQVTIWSSPGQVARTCGFVRDEIDVVHTLLTFFGGGTTFPLLHLRADHPAGRVRGPFESRVHLACLSDSGVLSMFGQDQPPELARVAHDALQSAGGGGSLILNVPASASDQYREFAGGYAVYAVPTLQDLVPFARAFAARTWSDSARSAAPQSVGGAS